ncbi:PPE family protein [Mycobacterium sp. M1]|uniref:PPE family protein n=1 Tax=Mycolicibacter acidiphilus TaxID=2835306 RepID=A0ABS5REG6_9MYCO|nr:PPE family protein [Mycolicibacter acidiphilus]MBS9532667.1 PPE family protein [Mycolicibacter acidiphilus]
MDFSALSPEVNSGRMYAGPGSGPMLAAATAWGRLATELTTAAGAYGSVLSGLTDEGWLGPAADAMAAAAAPFTTWLHATAESAAHAASGATAAAAAFEAAHAAVVPPAVVAANRAELAALIAGNVLGQNTAAIAAVETQYALMWVQDAAAMYGYALHSAVASRVSPFTQPPATTSPSASAAQASAVGAATASSGHAELTQLMSALPHALQGLAGSAAAAAPVQAADPISLSQAVSYVGLVARSIVPFNDAIKSILYGFVQYARNLNTDLDVAAATGGRYGFGSGTLAPPPLEPVVAPATPVVTAGAGGAGSVGRVSVPPGWAGAAPEVAMTATSIPITGLTAAPAAAAAQIPAGIYSDLAAAGLAGRAITGAAPRGRPAAAMNGHAQTRLERLVTELAGTHEVQHWHVDSSRLDSLLEELAEQPGVHAVHVNPDGQDHSGIDVENTDAPDPQRG